VRRATLGGIGLLAALASALPAQVRPTFTLGARLGDPGTATPGGMAFGSALRWSRPGLGASGAASVFGQPGDRWGTDGAVDVRLGGHRIGWRPVAELSGAWDVPGYGLRRGELTGRALIERAGRRLSLRAGLSAARPIGSEFAWALGGLAAADIRLGALTISGRVGRSVARVNTRPAPASGSNPVLPPQDTLGFATSGGPSLIPIADTGVTDSGGNGSVSVTPTVATLGVRWSGPSLRLEARLARRFAVGTATGMGWSVGARVAAADGLVVRLDAGFLPAGDALFLPNHHYLALGLELVNRRPAAGSIAEPAVSRAGALTLARRNGPRATLTIRNAAARSVEVMGDFTDWRPVPMTRTLGDVWSLTTAIPAGVHQVNLRLNGGAWSVPPGLPRADDGFGGEVGILVAP
jgi:hypothetical protein